MFDAAMRWTGIGSACEAGSDDDDYAVILMSCASFLNLHAFGMVMLRDMLILQIFQIINQIGEFCLADLGRESC